MANIYFQSLLKDGLDPFYPTPSVKSIPGWWKDMPKMMKQKEGEPLWKRSHTVKGCPAVNDAINFGYSLYTQVDIYIKTTDTEIFWQYPLDPLHEKNREPYITNHGKESVEGYKLSENFLDIPIRINMGFAIKTDPGYSVLVKQLSHRNDLPFIINEGIIDSDLCTIRENVSMFFKKNLEIIIPAGTPFVQVFPFKRENFESKFTDFDYDDDIKRELNLFRHFLNGYKKNFWSRKIFR